MKITDNLLFGYLNNSLTAQDKIQVEMWLAEDTANSKHINQLQKMWSDVGNLKEYRLSDEGGAWNSVRKTIQAIPVYNVAPQSKSFEKMDVLNDPELAKLELDSPKTINEKLGAQIKAENQNLKIKEAENVVEQTPLKSSTKESSDYGIQKATRTIQAPVNPEEKSISEPSPKIEIDPPPAKSVKEEFGVVKKIVKHDIVPQKVTQTVREADDHPIVSNDKTVYSVENDNDSGWLKWLIGLLLFAFLAYLVYPYIVDFIEKQQSSLVSTNTEKTVQTADGSSVFLSPKSSADFYWNAKDSLRKFKLKEGGARFNIVHGFTPFRFEYKDVAIDGNSAEFEIYQKDGFIEAKCNEDSIQLYEKNNESNIVTIHAGESYRYSMGTFTKNLPLVDSTTYVIDENQNNDQKSVTSANIKEIYLVDLLDFIMENSNWRVITAPSMPFDPYHVVSIDTDLDYVEILKDLRGKIDIEYKQLKCEGCYEVKRMKM